MFVFEFAFWHVFALIGNLTGRFWRDCPTRTQKEKVFTTSARLLGDRKRLGRAASRLQDCHRMSALFCNLAAALAAARLPKRTRNKENWMAKHNHFPTGMWPFLKLAREKPNAALRTGAHIRGEEPQPRGNPRPALSCLPDLSALRTLREASSWDPCILWMCLLV